MNSTILHIALMAIIAVCATGVYAEEGDHEDLSACKLPNGVFVIPAERSPEARKNGEVFSFSKNKLAPRPVLEGEQWTAKDLFAKLLETKAGDVMYSRAEQGVFLAVSTRIADLGKHYLYEFDGKELTRPEVPYGKEERKETPGLIEGVSKLDGHCFLVETAEGKVAIFRLISSSDRNARIQWVYQPDGGRKFVIPKGKITSEAAAVTETTPNSDTRSGLSIARLDVRDFSKAAETHLENRKKMVEISIDLVSSKDANLSNRHSAAILLGQLRAVEGASALAAHVDNNLAMVSLRITVSNSYRCVPALINIGIQGALASMSQLEIDAKSDAPKESDLRLWNDRIELRRNLLALVVLKVYGEKLAKTVLEDKIAESADSKVKEAYQKALEAFPRIKNWLPEEKAAITMPATMPVK